MDSEKSLGANADLTIHVPQRELLCFTHPLPPLIEQTHRGNNSISKTTKLQGSCPSRRLLKAGPNRCSNTLYIPSIAMETAKLTLHSEASSSSPSSGSTPDLLLYDIALSSYAQKVRTALRLKNLPFKTYTPPNLGAGYADPDFSSANPRMEVPALKDGNFTVFDSTAILMYLEDKYTTSPQWPSLFPPGGDTPEMKAEARMIEEVCDTHYEAINWAGGEVTWFKRAEGVEAERLNKAIKEQTDQILSWLEEKLGDKDFFSGTKVGYADICVAPMLNRSVVIGTGPVEGSKLRKWHERMGRMEAVRETWREVEEAVPKMKGFGPEMWAKGNGPRREYRDHRLEFMVKNGALGIVQKGIEDGNIRFSWPHPRK